MELFGNCQGSGSVKVTQDSLEQYLSLQEHREVPVNNLNCCDWTAGGCIYPVSAINDSNLDSEDLHALKSVYQERLGLDKMSSFEMPFPFSEFKAFKLGSVLYGSMQGQTTWSSFVLANWAGTEGSLASSTGCDD